jgi:hypothetical protein
MENFDTNNYKFLRLRQTVRVWGLILNCPFNYKYPTGK